MVTDSPLTAGEIRRSISLGCKILATGFLLLLGLFLLSPATRATGPLTVAELASFAKTTSPTLLEKANQVLSTPVYFSYGETGSPVRTRGKLGPALRVASWNIERGAELGGLLAVLNPAESHHKPDDQEAATWLASSDVFVFSEVDIGMGRSHYANVPKILAQKLGMYAVYAPEFLELAPFFRESNSDETGKPIDPERYKGLHGSLVLSRYPIVKAQILRLPVAYDWFNAERQKQSDLERLRRSASKKFFAEDVYTEVRYGGRLALIVTLAVPLPDNKTQTVTVVALHLENRCPPAGRLKQMEAVLKVVKPIQNPVILAGDWNTTGTDVSPTSVTKEVRVRLKDPNFWGRQAITWLSPFGLPINLGLNTSQYFKNLFDPTTRNIPVIFPNKEEALFSLLQNFRFDDGLVFDFRGDKRRSYHHHFGRLSNANQRWFKGFVPTFTFERPWLKGAVGRYKLDWLMVKGFTGITSDTDSTYRFAPHFGRTLLEINRATLKDPVLKTRLSDHDPLTVDLPLTEPDFSHKH